MSEKLPIVSICCITYNHAPFIRKALDGFLMQEPPTGVTADEPWYEILIHDDASTDGTDDIIREYSEKYPDRIFPLYETENQYSKTNVKIDLYNFERVRGKYIAYCEGDDYWSDSQKLQKQVDYMEEHPDYSVCFHRFRDHNVTNDTYNEVTLPTLLLRRKGSPDGLDIDEETFFEAWYTQPLTMLFRVSMMVDLPTRNSYKKFRDMHEIFYLLQNGKGRLMNFDGGVRNVHEGGVASMISRKMYCDISLPMDGELFWRTKNKYAKRQYLETLEECVKEYRNSNKWKAFKCAFICFAISGHPRGLIRHFKMIFGK